MVLSYAVIDWGFKVYVNNWLSKVPFVVLLIVAIKKEAAANSFYKALSELTGNAAHRSVFEALAKEEDVHKTRLQNLYDDVFQPDMWENQSRGSSTLSFKAKFMFCAVSPLL